jgi:hypothetical protein
MRATANIAAVREYTPVFEIADRVLAAKTENAANTAARFVKNVVLFAAAPFIGLAYVIALPFVGIGALAWLGLRAARGRARN